MKASPHPETPTPAGRDEVTAALLAATERLCATGQPSSFSVRQIAFEARATTSLLYFYFKSKDDIILATLKSVASEIDVAVAGADGVGAIVSAVSRALAERPAFPRLLAWFVLEGRGFAELSDDPVLERLIAAFTSDGAPDPHTHAGVAVTLLLGNALLAGAVNEGLERSSHDERLIQALNQALAAVTSQRASGPASDKASPK
jgi:AcrR family transcriptional regulator